MPNITKEYLIAKDKTSEYLILTVIIFLIVIVWTGILFVSTQYQTGDNTTTAYLKCPAGECPTNRFTGQKRCSKNVNQEVEYDPIFEICNPSDSCKSTITPYALQSDGSTTISGICDINGCSCVNFLATPAYTEVLFNSQNGNFLSTSPSLQTRLTLVQQPSPYVGEGNIVPMYYTNPDSQFYTINSGALSYLSPNPCSNLYENGPDVGTNVSLKCINRNPCVVGAMAYIPSNAAAFAAFTNTNLISTSVGCVPNTVENPVISGSNSCAVTDDAVAYPKQYAPVFNPQNGRIQCIITNVDNTV